MSKKLSITDPFQPKITRNDRFAQMSHQEKVIEQKKREIQAKLEAKQKGSTETTTKASSPTPPNKQSKSPPKKVDIKKSTGFNLFSNDGSFLDTFKQMKDKKLDSKLKSFKSKDHGEQRIGNKNSRWSQRRRSPSPKDRNLKSRISRFSEKPNNFEPKITINTSFNNPVSQHNFDNPQISISPQNVTGQPLLKNILPPPGVVFPTPNQQTSAPVIAAPPLLLNVPPPQIVPSQVNNTLLLPSSAGNVLVSTPTVSVTIPASGVLTTVTLPPPSIISTQPVTVSTANAIPVPPPCVPAVELASIPPPNPIQVQNIPQPEPINTLNIPHPAPIQVQNIPTPTSIQLNEIPNPKPLDLLAIPTPNEDKSISDPDFIKNIPPPNKSIPPPTLPEPNVNIPPPNTPVQSTCLPPPNIIPVSIPPPQSIATPTLPQNLTVQSITPCQNILVHTIPPPPQIQTIQNISNNQAIQNITTGVPPPNIQNQNNFASVSSISVALPVGVVPSSPVTVTNTIPSLMAQPILPPPGMGVATVNVNCPPPMLPTLQAPPPPSFVNQPPPITNQMPPMNVPPPPTTMAIMNPAPITGPPFRDMNAGTPDYEAMASLGRMVAQCGPGIEDVVRQRKTQDPNLWFLFHKESAAYQQYQQLVEQFKREINAKNEANEAKDTHYKPEDIYEPEMAIEDENDTISMKLEKKTDSRENESEGTNKRKRKSRWGDKDTSIPPPIVLNPTPGALPRPGGPQAQSGNVMLSKITRSDPGLIQYTVNTYGSTNLSEEEWKKAEDNYKINILYQDMMKKREELEKLQLAGKNKYDYDSDEDVDGGTWEHKLRDKEMMATQLWAQELTRQAEGKHHIGDFLPPEELKRFLEKSNLTKERLPNNSDYKDFKIKEDNIGFKMLQKLGWSQGQGLGSNGAGIVEPINKAAAREQNQGLGLGETDEDKEDEYEAYRKRMMLAYRFRPNPLNNPRRPYY
ncbi:arginine-glutamic acid dipeptide repeats protein-like isoform X2 [Zophobas morio]|uniref:arginine-glutamic acid dipeptide repeats protein-like isoform X2 n=1 Tax=Zophobas morio TaxID=2755281 RepID=UPI003082896D